MVNEEMIALIVNGHMLLHILYIYYNNFIHNIIDNQFSLIINFKSLSKYGYNFILQVHS